MRVQDEENEPEWNNDGGLERACVYTGIRDRVWWMADGGYLWNGKAAEPLYEQCTIHAECGTVAMPSPYAVVTLATARNQ